MGTITFKLTYQCVECDQVVKNHQCDACGSHNVEIVHIMNCNVRKPKKDDFK